MFVTLYNAVAMALGVVVVGHAIATGGAAEPIWYAVVLVFGASAWVLWHRRVGWMARLAVALNAALAFLIVVILGNLTLLRDETGLTFTATAPRILVAALGLALVTANIRGLIRPRHPRSSGSEDG